MYLAAAAELGKHGGDSVVVKGNNRILHAR
jgi:hypothetical protein